MKHARAFDIEGVFMDHMVSISYGLVFTRLEEITEGVEITKIHMLKPRW
jgi:hypothetical protein